MKIMTLNVNGFRGRKQKGQTVDDKELEYNIIKFNKFMESMIGEDDILVVQEFPHMQSWNYKQENLSDKSEYKFAFTYKPEYEFAKRILEKSHQIIWPVHLKGSDQCTVAIVKPKSQWKRIEPKEEIISYNTYYIGKTEVSDYGNKVIEARYEKTNLTVLGLHMNVQTDTMWKMILKSVAKGFSFIAGDFNANELKGEMREYPQKLRDEGYISLVPSNMVTAAFPHNEQPGIMVESSVDNIYINQEYRITGDASIKVSEPTGFISDHKLCEVEF